MKLIVLFFTCWLTCSANAQDQWRIWKKIIFYKVSLTDTTGTGIKGYLAGFNDTALLLLPDDYEKAKAMITTDYVFTSIVYRNINEISFRRKGSTGRGIKIGALYTAGIGAIAGTALVGLFYSSGLSWFSENVEFGITATRLIVIPTIIGGVAGGLGGGMIGLFTNRFFTIHGSKQEFDHMRIVMLKKMYRK